MYLTGDGVKQDYVQAYAWYTLSLMHGNQDARTGLEFLEKEMTTTEISRAQSLAKEWAAKYTKERK